MNMTIGKLLAITAGNARVRVCWSDGTIRRTIEAIGPSTILDRIKATREFGIDSVVQFVTCERNECGEVVLVYDLRVVC